MSDLKRVREALVLFGSEVGDQTLRYEAQDDLDAHLKEDAAEQMKLGGYVNLVKKLEAELAKLRELERHFVWVQDSEVPICPNEAELARLREVVDVGAQNYDDLKEDYTELLEAVKAHLNNCIPGPRLRQLIEEADRDNG